MSIDSSAWSLLLHGAVVLVIGNLCGFPFGRAIARRQLEDVQRAWRVAHTGLAAGGAMMIASGAALAVLQPSVIGGWLVTVFLIAGGCSFAIALPITAVTGHRGITMGRSAAARIVFSQSEEAVTGSDRTLWSW